MPWLGSFGWLSSAREQSLNYPFSDTFARGDGALGSPWTAEGTWAISTNKVANTPATFGASELVTNGDFAAWTADDPDGWTVTGESGSDPEVSEVATNEGHGGTGTGACNIFTSTGLVSIAQTILTAGLWYKIGFKITNRVAGTVSFSSINLAYSALSVATFSFIARATGTEFKIARSGATDITLDDISVVTATLAELLATVPTSAADATGSIALTVGTADTAISAGLVMRLDDATTPLNFLIAYYYDQPGGGPRVNLDKCVNGTYTNLIGATVTYAAGAALQLVCSGSSVSVYYNSLQVGTTQTVSDAGILGNKIHGMFSTGAGITLDSFSLT